MLTSPTGDDLSRSFDTFDISARRSVIAAVSGGSDSTALLLLLKDYLDRHGGDTRLVAVTIDHQLRDGSAAEAEAVGRLCARHGISHRILAWTGPKPATGIAAAAREARYRLLAEAAREAGTDLVLTGHTADDQAETVLMRQARDGGRGLAGMATATLFDGAVWLARPLLDARRAKLRDFLARQGIGWADDPTNSDAKYERSRVRTELGSPGGGGRVEAALTIAAKARADREQLGLMAAAVIDLCARRVAPGLIRLDPVCLDTQPREAVLYALRILLAATGAKEQLPDESRTATLLDRLRVKKQCRGVLSRTLVDRRAAGIFLLREARGLPLAPTIPREEGGGAVTRSPSRLWEGHTQATADVPASLVRAAAATAPSSAPPILAPWHRFLPSFDLMPARAAARLFGAAEIPDPPFPGHNGRKA